MNARKSPTLNDFNFGLFSYLSGMKLVKKGDGYVKLHDSVGFGAIELYDNGGEVNVYAERPAMTAEQKGLLQRLYDTDLVPYLFKVMRFGMGSLPYTNQNGRISEITLLYRLRRWLENDEIDWNLLEGNEEWLTPEFANSMPS